MPAPPAPPPPGTAPAPDAPPAEAGPGPPVDVPVESGIATQPAETPDGAALGGDTFVRFANAAKLGALATGAPGSPGSAQGGVGGQGEVTGQGTAGPTAGETAGRYESPEKFPDDLKSAFEALARAPFGVKIGGGAAAAGSTTQALFRQYQMVPHDLLKRSPAVFLFLNTVVGKYPPAETLRMAARHGVDLGKVVTALVLDPPAQPETIARLAGKHQLGADRAAILRQAEHMANSPDPLMQLAGRFTKTVLGQNQQALQSMLTDPVTFFNAQMWNKLKGEQQGFMADGAKSRKATGMLGRGGLSARGLAQLIGDHEEEGQPDGDGQQQPQGASELQQQKAFYDGWRATLIKGIKDSADTKAGRTLGPPQIATTAASGVASGRAVYDPVRKTVRLGAAFPECLRLHTHGLTFTVAPDGELLEIALRNPQDRWELKRDLAPPVVAGLDASRVRVVDAREGAQFATHDRFFTSQDRNVIYLQVEKRPVARRALAASNLLLELDDGGHLLGIVIWQLAAARAAKSGDQKAWIAGLADKTPRLTST